MNATARTLLVFFLLLVAVVVASFLYRGSRSATENVAAEGPVAAAVDPETLHPELKQALDAMAENRDDDAIGHLRAVPADSPNYPTVLRHLAVLTARKGNFEEAIQSLLALTERYADDPEIHASLGWVFYLADRPRDAEFAALRALELAPDHKATRYNIGLYRVAQGRSQLAISSYVRALRNDPNATQVTRHRDRLWALHDEHPELPAAHFALAFFADAMQDPRTEVDELEHYLERALPGPERDAAVKKLEQVRERMRDS
ncbi:MAG: tetratricopeptide repeat protein [Acidobacteria bacterium]|nr:tetratricopeptide repeat protein [Acidobacteriota bacterium]NIM60650.1 tetratricopeptide repeat protein [Acidobacteriota bacterium]NIO57937.1 tetratricopeptide repeat protein [Acidobacteriota bacterium]NIQ28940.1 tetratricopeptide repeat protein [Acidobacteriota bacterium]NIQ83414.1 tetratricopeptide repeat protein [Acidobacteriota bacterium]